VKSYEAKGAFAGVVAGPDRFDDGATGLDLAAAPGGRVFVLDPKRRAVRVFEPVKEKDASRE
jgi:hypothetical protein